MTQVLFLPCKKLCLQGASGSSSSTHQRIVVAIAHGLAVGRPQCARGQALRGVHVQQVQGCGVGEEGEGGGERALGGRLPRRAARRDERAPHKHKHIATRGHARTHRGRRGLAVRGHRAPRGSALVRAHGGSHVCEGVEGDRGCDLSCATVRAVPQEETTPAHSAGSG